MINDSSKEAEQHQKPAELQERDADAPLGAPEAEGADDRLLTVLLPPTIQLIPPGSRGQMRRWSRRRTTMIMHLQQSSKCLELVILSTVCYLLQLYTMLCVTSLVRLWI